LLGKRRTILKGTLAASALGSVLSTGLTYPRIVKATWPNDAFQATSIADALAILTGSGETIAASDEILFAAFDECGFGAHGGIFCNATWERKTHNSIWPINGADDFYGIHFKPIYFTGTAGRSQKGSKT